MLGIYNTTLLGSIAVLVIGHICVGPTFFSTESGTTPARVIPSSIGVITASFHLVHHEAMVCDEELVFVRKHIIDYGMFLAPSFSAKGTGFTMLRQKSLSIEIMEQLL
jgi:hypothetical protein